ncbi:hypothetical protein AMAG_17462 [Allomyces macrogynus ATCC 38327]|uniref:Uncharacterized protein n=1 Tax=Allomyces macrogynus (strain ATCC 38327) TaxID=578462 RepID=A0A0L0TF58_ALLM3|nr:hypothetical protein AMAG_17462 [Allomyces macrogynus ATCC 38327]|eukprot:KNE73296.1 hypothetical protein AMAG_17462 [Allomyces macrogynus ATCC 38327]
MTLSVSVKMPISSQPAMIEMLKANGLNWPTFANRFLGFLTADQLEDLLKLKSFKVLVDAEFKVMSLEQQEEMMDAQFKKLVELDSDVKFVADMIYWNGPATAKCKKCMAHNSYKAKLCIWTIIKVVLLSAIASELLLVFSDATCVTDAWGLFTKPMSGTGAVAVCEHIASLQRCFDMIQCHEHAKSSLHLRTDFADSFLVLTLLS